MMDNGKPDFHVLQFKALRDEILGIKERVIRLQTIGITGIPLVIGAGEKFNLSAILMASPLITLMFTFMLVFEQNSLMRAGKYIKENIEKPPFCPDTLIGWENWLAAEPERRKAEAFFAWSAYIAFVVYFAIGSYLAYSSIYQRMSTIVAMAALSLYGAGFFFSFYLVVIHMHTTNK